MDRKKIHNFCKLRGADIGVVAGLVIGAAAGLALTGGGAFVAYSVVAGQFGPVAGIAAGAMGLSAGYFIADVAARAAFFTTSFFMTAAGDMTGRLINLNIGAARGTKKTIKNISLSNPLKNRQIAFPKLKISFKKAQKSTVSAAKSRNKTASFTY